MTVSVKTLVMSFVALLAVATALNGIAADTINDLKQEVAEIRKRISATPQANIVDKTMSHRFGAAIPVETKTPKLYVGGLLQLWYYNTQNDNRGLFDSPNGTGIADTNEASDNDSFHVRRAELALAMNIHKNVTTYVMLDFAYDINTIPFLPTNQNFRTANYVSPEFSAANGVFGNPAAVSTAQAGGGVTPNVLQDALINFHGIVPHHDFTIGQYMYTFSLEQFGPNSMLDFVERSVIGNSFAREMGLTIHGSWWDNAGGNCYCGAADNGRFQYWLSIFNGAGNYNQTSGFSLNRTDDNDEKDFLGTVLVRPVWKDENWGSLELAWSAVVGIHGESGGDNPIASPVNGLNRPQNRAYRHQGFVHYRPGGPARGLWIKSEAQWIKDRNGPLTVVDLTANDPLGIGFQSNGRAFLRSGFYVSSGYHLGQSALAKHCGPLKNFEFTFRYEQFETVFTADPANPARTNAHMSKAITAGFNYYIRGHDAKIQANYINVNNPDGSATTPFHNVRNDTFVVSYQVAF